MLLFNGGLRGSNLADLQISKHPMLLFNIKFHTQLDCISVISKHPMLLFNEL